MNDHTAPDRRSSLGWLAARNPLPPTAESPPLDERARADFARIIATPATATEHRKAGAGAGARGNRRLLLLGVGAIVVAAVAGLSWTTHPIHHHLEASWANAYPTIPQMMSASDAVVVGRVTGVRGTSVDADTAIRYTDFEFTVDTWITGATAPQLSAPVTIHQMGSAAGFVTEDVADDPLLHLGEHDVLFLSAYAPGKYSITGGPTGRYTIDGTAVTHLPASLIQLPAGLQLAAFEQQLAAAARAR